MNVRLSYLSSLSYLDSRGTSLTSTGAFYLAHRQIWRSKRNDAAIPNTPDTVSGPQAGLENRFPMSTSISVVGRRRLIVEA